MQQVYKDNLNKPSPYVPADDWKKPRTGNLYVHWTYIQVLCVHLRKCFFQNAGHIFWTLQGIKVKWKFKVRDQGQQKVKTLIEVKGQSFQIWITSTSYSFVNVYAISMIRVISFRRRQVICWRITVT